MTKILIQNGRVVDPSQDFDQVTTVVIDDGRIVGFDDSPTENKPNAGLEVIDARGKIVAPGLIDMHVHLREPGGEDDETIRSGTLAALAGGFTSIACVADTDPPIDTQGAVQFILHQAAKAGGANVFVVACVSKNREGNQLAEIGQLVQAGAIAFSDDGASIQNAELMRRALEYLLMFDKPLLSHAEAAELTTHGVMHEGLTSMVLALPGMPAEAEDVMTGRDIALAEATGGCLHMMHVSSAGSVDAIRRAKARGVRVTAEVTPHHLSLTDETLRSFDANFKINPPLRGARHVKACLAGLADGTLDAIATDHAPHAVEKKMQELDQAPFGVIGLETALGVVATHVIRPGHLDWPAAIAAMTIHPARILGVEKGTLAAGADADVTIIDPDAEWTVDPSDFQSKSVNTPFAGMRLTGRAETVIVGGQIRWDRRAESQV